LIGQAIDVFSQIDDIMTQDIKLLIELFIFYLTFKFYKKFHAHTNVTFVILKTKFFDVLVTKEVVNSEEYLRNRPLNFSKLKLNLNLRFQLNHLVMFKFHIQIKSFCPFLCHVGFRYNLDLI
jgi:hypothetical protein